MKQIKVTDKNGNVSTLPVYQIDKAKLDALDSKCGELETRLESCGGLSDTAKTLLQTILSNAVYVSDQSANITSLIANIGVSSGGSSSGGSSSGGSSSGGTTTTSFTITKNLTNCVISNSASSINQGSSYSATISANSGYTLGSVVVTMGGQSVSVTNGVISIASVSGNIVITASASQSASGGDTPSEPTNDVITFADSAVKALCVSNWGSGGEITKSQAAAVTNLGSVFTGNTEITSFNELEYFTGLPYIYNQWFEGCTALTSIKIPSSVTYLGIKAFCGCTSLVTCALPNTLTEIRGAAFESCANLEMSTLPSSLTTLNNPFYNCAKITIDTIPSGVKTWVAYMFKGCALVTKIKSSVNVVSNYAGNGSYLEEVEFLDNITSFDNSAFYSVSTLKKVVLRGSNVPTITANSFKYTHKDILFYVKDELLSQFETDDIWSTYYASGKIKGLSELV